MRSKKIIAMLLLTSLTFSVVGCSDTNTTESKTTIAENKSTVSKETSEPKDSTTIVEDESTTAETTSVQETETTTEEVTTTTEPESKSYEVKIPEVNPDWQTASAVTLDVPFVRISDNLKGAGGTAIACATMIFNYYGTTVTQEDITDEYIELMSKDRDEYTFVNPRTTDAPAQQYEINILGTYIYDFYSGNMNIYYFSKGCSSIAGDQAYIKDKVFAQIRDGFPVYTICSTDLTSNTNAVVVLVVGFNNDNNTVLVADPTKDDIIEYNQDEFFTSMYSYGGNNMGGTPVLE